MLSRTAALIPADFASLVGHVRPDVGLESDAQPVLVVEAVVQLLAERAELVPQRRRPEGRLLRDRILDQPVARLGVALHRVGAEVAVGLEVLAPADDELASVLIRGAH